MYFYMINLILSVECFIQTCKRKLPMPKDCLYLKKRSLEITSVATIIPWQYEADVAGMNIFCEISILSSTKETKKCKDLYYCKLRHIHDSAWLNKMNYFQ